MKFGVSLEHLARLRDSRRNFGEAFPTFCLAVALARLSRRERERERGFRFSVWVECGILRCVRRCEGCGGNAEFREPGHGHREEEEEEERFSSRYAAVLSPLDPKSTAKDCRITGLQVYYRVFVHLEGREGERRWRGRGGGDRA